MLGFMEELQTEPQTELPQALPPIDVAVKCSFSEMVDPKSLIPHPANPNKHPPKQIEMFIAILAFQGWRRPITVSRRSGFVTKGHGALESALHANLASVPVDYQDYASEMEELADLVADNQLQRMSEMDTGKLTHLLTGLDSGAFNMELTGFENQRLEKLMTAAADRPNLPLAGTDGAPAVEGAIGGHASTVGEGVPNDPAMAHVRMVQLFFNETTVDEFMKIVDYFQKEINTANVTDTVLEVLRSAFRAHGESPVAQT